MSITPEQAARELLEVVPIITKDIRSEMRSRRSSDLTVPQFRTLAFVNRNVGSIAFGSGKSPGADSTFHI